MIPIFRANKLGSDEYIIGDLFDGKYIIAKSELNRDISEALKHIREDILTKECISDNCKNEHHLLSKMLNKLLVNERLEHIYEIDPTTISIHFPDMVDSEGTKIFASLSDNGKGGDICDFPNHSPLTAMRNTIDNDFDFGNVRCFKNYHMDCKVIGIQE